MKKIKTLVLLVLSLVLINTYSKPVHADEGSGLINNITMWADGIKFVSALTDSDGENMAQLVNKFFTGIVDVMLGYMCPECIEGYEERIENSDLPRAYKVGWIGFMDDQVVAAFGSQPRVDVIAHLSNEWVPGYKESNSAYAVNTGYEDLQGARIDTIWSKTRDIAYVGFVVIMIVIGFMIMFRNKIGGQVMVTVGNALPRVIISLILVTFSFAIVGLILDISGFVMSLMMAIFDENIQIHNIIDLMTTTNQSYKDIITPMRTIIRSIPLMGTVMNWWVGVAVFFIGGIVLFAALKLWFTLIKSYFLILLNTVIAPLALLVGAVPGNELVPINVFKSILRSALVFPVAFAIVALPYYLAKQEGVVLGMPSSIVGDDTADLIVIGPILIFYMQLAAIFIAAETPKFMLGIIPASSPKSGMDIGGAIKEALGGLPLVGGMFRSKK